MNFIYNLSGFAVFIALIMLIIGIIKPSALTGIFKKYATRKHIVIAGLTSIIAFGSLVSATEPESVKQARLAKENAVKQSSQIQANNQQNEPPKEEIKTEKKDIQEKEVVAFAKEQRNDASRPAGQKAIIQNGKNGEKTLTYEITFIDGKETFKNLKSEAVTIAPVNEITAIGTYVASPPPAPKYVAPSTSSPSTGARTGATCRDGSHSNATGSGACSHHGGVAVWLYN